MTTVDLPDPVTRPLPRPDFDTAALERALRERVDGEVRFDAGTRGAYSTDGSNYRQVPDRRGACRAHAEAAVQATVGRAASTGRRVLSRGGGTSLAGQCTNAAVVIDWSKYCHRLVSVDAGRAAPASSSRASCSTCSTGTWPPTGLEFGPEPATHSHCTLGGMIGNNSCGATAQRTARSSTTRRAWRCCSYDGTRFWVRRDRPTSEYAEIRGGGDRRAEIYRAAARRCATRYADEIRRRYPDIPRRVSGYNLDSLLPEHGFDVAGRWSAARARWSPCCAPSWSWCRCSQAEHPGRAGLPRHRRRRRRRAPRSLPHRAASRWRASTTS